MKKELFEHEISILRDTFRRLLRRHAKPNLIKLIGKTHPADLALLFRYFNDEEQRFLFDLIIQHGDLEDFIPEMDESILANLLEDKSPELIVDLLRKLDSSDRAEILNMLEEEKATAVMNLLHLEEVEEVEEFLAYPEDSAGAMMYTDVFALHEDTRAQDAIMTLQDQEDAEMVFYLYVIDDDNHLVGVISLRDLVTTPPETLLKDIMIKHVHSVRPETDQEEVARIVSRYNYLAVPVVDKENHLLGIVTVDDVVDVIREEATEDFLQMAGAGKDREILLKPVMEESKLRFPWLFATWIGGIGASFIVSAFGLLLNEVIALAAFMPIIAGMGGNIGTQSSAIVVRGLATGRIDFDNYFKVIFKELRVGLLLGIAYGLLLGLFAHYRYIDAPPLLGVAVGTSICITMLLATMMGTAMPILLRKLNLDPAIATGPFVTTSTDILGVANYFLIASFLLHLG
ncbi:MAG: magnesium transporter [Candidatus Neomarinimicrobiota bacterium]|nr:MAG: magnesium transporter [Candidatus Neomarinimicrobiota bacterium]